MTFTKEQMETLSSFEKNFRTARQSKYTRGIGTSGYTTMHRILKEATGINLPFRPSCYSCMFRLVSITGEYYFDDKEEMEKAHSVELKEQKEEVKVEKAVVKTTKPKTKKTKE